MTKPAKYTFSGEHVLQTLTEFETLLASKGFAIHGLNGPVSPLERADLVDEFLEKYRVPEFSGADMVRMK